MPLPEVFTELKNTPITSTAFPKSKQFIVLEDVLRILNRCKKPEQLPGLMLEAIKLTLNTENMNIFTRAYMLRRLLDIYALASEFHRMAINKSAMELDDCAKDLYAKWYMPSIEAENPNEVKKLKEFFQKFSAEHLELTAQTSSALHRQALNRGLTPGGIVLNNAQGQQHIHWFSGMEVVNELWFYTEASGKQPAGWIVLDKKSNLDAKSKTLKNHQLKLPHGTVFFVPFDELNTAELAEKFKSKAAGNKVDVIVWPDTWPLNKR